MIFAHPVGDIKAWAQRLVDDLNRFHRRIEDLPVFADDVAAATGKVRVGEGYVDSNGFVRRRLA